MTQILIGFIVPIIIYIIIWYLVKRENERVWTPSEIIDYIARYYTSRTRSISNRRNDLGCSFACKYTDHLGRHCAFGLISIDPLSYNEGVGAFYILNSRGFDILKPQFIIPHSNNYDRKKFYEDLQLLHDREDNWNEFGISLKGKVVVQVLKETYK